MTTIPDGIRVTVEPLPGTIRAFARRMKSGHVCIVVNACLDIKEREKALAHELEHVIKNDFDREDPVEAIETSL
jgi:Zn-dependent peptidase ImmA (M78 family)